MGHGGQSGRGGTIVKCLICYFAAGMGRISLRMGGLTNTFMVGWILFIESGIPKHKGPLLRKMQKGKVGRIEFDLQRGVKGRV